MDAQEACQRISEAGAAKAKAEADSVRQLVLGFLLAQRRGTAAAPQAALRRSLDKVVTQLGAIKAKASAPAPKPVAAGSTRRSMGQRVIQRRMLAAPLRNLKNLAKGKTKGVE